MTDDTIQDPIAALAADQAAQDRIRAATMAQMEALTAPEPPRRHAPAGAANLSPELRLELMTTASGSQPLALPDLGDVFGVRVIDVRSGAVVTVQVQATYEGGVIVSVDPDLKVANRIRLGELAANQMQIRLDAVAWAGFGLYPDDEP